MSNESNPTMATFKDIIKGHKNRILRELYDKNDEIDQVLNFTLIAYYPVNFDEAMKEKVWIKSMDE